MLHGRYRPAGTNANVRFIYRAGLTFGYTFTLWLTAHMTRAGTVVTRFWIIFLHTPCIPVVLVY